MFEEVLSISGHQLRQEFPISPEQSRQLEHILERLLRHEPVQYVLGHAWFMGEKYRVNESTLIPRSETEELVEWIREEEKGSGALRVLDIGTGSGCIAISLQKGCPDWVVYGMDISEGALEMARQNANSILGASIPDRFFQNDILKPQSRKPEAPTYDLIVSNPPYVRELEKSEMRPEVLEYEPHSALFVPDRDPLVFYRHIARFAQSALAANGRLYFEINEFLGQHTLEMLNGEGFAAELKKDMQGRDRMIRAWRKS